MWVVAAILLALVVTSLVAGFHTGPHTHLVAGVAGVAAAVWLIVMAALGHSAVILFVLLGGDIAITGLAGYLGVRALRNPTALEPLGGSVKKLDGLAGVAVSALSPEGVVRVAGEDWTAVSLNGVVREGGRIQVINTRGVRLEVWGEPDELSSREDPSEESGS